MALSVRVRVAVVSALFAPAVALASTAAVTEGEALRLFLEESPQARRIPAIVRSVDAASRVEARLPNPEVAYQIEDSAGVRDQFLTFQQQLPISGRRGLVHDSADVAASSARLAAERNLWSAASEVRQAFYEVLYHESVARRLSQGTRRLERVVQILAAREREGEGSGYDLLRSEQELAEIAIRSLEIESKVSTARVRFGAFYAAERGMEFVRLEGAFQPSAQRLDPEVALERALSRRGDLKALRASTLRLDLERRAARRLRFPEPILTAGWKRTELLGLDDTGFIASLALPLPIFDRGQFSAKHAIAERERAELDIEILEREIRADVQAALTRERVALQAAERYGDEVEQRAAELRRIAELAYEDGEARILELLDAYRTSLATELRALAVRYEAKRAEIDRDRAIGAEVKP